MPASTSPAPAPAIARSPGRPARTTREAIADAALRIGFDSATVKKIGAELGMDHSSLYRHVSGRDDILLAAADLAVDRLDWRLDSPDWRLCLTHAADAVRRLYERHPGLAETLRSLPQTPKAVMAAFSELVSRLVALGFAPQDAAVLVDSVMDMTADCVSGWHQLRRQEGAGPPAAETMARRWQEHLRGGAATDRAAAALIAQAFGDPETWWRRKLDLLLDGAEAMLRRSSAG